MDDDFGIAAGAEPVAACDEAIAQLLKIVNLAVEGDPNSVVFIGQWLPSRGEVDDAEPRWPNAARPSQCVPESSGPR